MQVYVNLQFESNHYAFDIQSNLLMKHVLNKELDATCGHDNREGREIV